jgi:hypothetical protein
VPPDVRVATESIKLIATYQIWTKSSRVEEEEVGRLIKHRAFGLTQPRYASAGIYRVTVNSSSFKEIY